VLGRGAEPVRDRGDIRGTLNRLTTSSTGGLMPTEIGHCEAVPGLYLFKGARQVRVLDSDLQFGEICS
jgi:hypothetical protein